jgi:hypothetical protein
MPKLTPLGFQKQLREACAELSKTMSEEDWQNYQLMLIRDIANTHKAYKKGDGPGPEVFRRRKAG